MNPKFKKLAIIGSIALLTIAGATAAFARHGHDPERRVKWVEHVITSQLELDDEQKEKLSQVRTKVMGAYQRHRAERNQRFAAIEAMILADDLDQKQVQEMITESRTRIDNELPDVLDAVSDFHRSLSDEQKQKAVETLKTIKARHGH